MNCFRHQLRQLGLASGMMLYLSSSNAFATVSVSSFQPSPPTVNEGANVSVGIYVTSNDNLVNFYGTVDWGDGEGSGVSGLSSASTGHAYPDNGTYTVLFSGIGQDYYRNSFTGFRYYSTNPIGALLSVTVQNVAPTVQSIVEPEIEEATVPITFSATATDPGVDDVITFDWDFDGDGITDESGATGTHTYPLPGDYQVRVKARDDDGGVSSTFVKTITVSALQAPTFESVASARTVTAHSFEHVIEANRLGTDYKITGKLPPGLKFDPQTHRIYGNPTKPGHYELEVSATNAVGTGTQTFSLDVDSLSGAYAGLIQSPAATFDTSGSVNLKLAQSGAFTAKVSLAGKRYSVAGKFDGNGKFERAVSKVADAPVLKLQYTVPDRDHVTGQITPAGATALPFTLKRAPFKKTTNPAPQAARYTVVLPRPADPGLPRGHGYGTVVVDANGRISLLATLGDGTKISQKAAVAFDGSWPLQVNAYKFKGGIQADVTFSNELNSDFQGTLQWFKPETTAGDTVLPAFATAVDFLGSKYVAPAPGTEALSLTDTTVKIDLDGTGFYPFIKDVHFENNLFSGPAKTDFVMTLVKPTGLFTGKFFDSNTLKMTPFGGAIFQKQNNGKGLFRAGVQTGSIELAP